ncbi:MAG: hypothetical protein HRU13_13920 [Phycisphaerales bacterium]|nr:hypothetical protein [Phycisphaerales bacterium]
MSIPKSPIIAPIEYLEERIPLWQADPAAIGLSVEQVNAANVLVQAARDSYSSQQAAALAAENALSTRDQAIGDMRAFASSLIATIRAYARAESDPGVYAAAGLEPPAQPTPSPDPVAPTNVTIGLRPQGLVELRWEGSLALGTYYEVQRSLDNQVTWTAVDTVTTRELLDGGVPAGTAQASYRIRAKRPASGVGKAGTDTRVSPWTATVVISLGVPSNQALSGQGESGQAGGQVEAA